MSKMKHCAFCGGTNVKRYKIGPNGARKIMVKCRNGACPIWDMPFDLKDWNYRELPEGWVLVEVGDEIWQDVNHLCSKILGEKSYSPQVDSLAHSIGHYPPVLNPPKVQ